MRFFLINKKDHNQQTVKLFRLACKKLDIPFIELHHNNYQKHRVTENDLMYSISSDINAKNIQKLMISANPKTFFHKNSVASINLALENIIDSTIIHHQANLHIPKTNFINSHEEKALQKTVKLLKGFPVIIKEDQTEGGKGIKKADDLEEMKRISERLINRNKPYIVREYIHSPGVSYRAIILGKKVLIAYRNETLRKSDFRSNVGKTKREAITLTKDQKQLLIKSVESLGLEFGGVDFTFNDKNQIRIFEVNFPCNITQISEFSDLDIAKDMVQYLINKTRQRKG